MAAISEEYLAQLFEFTQSSRQREILSAYIEKNCSSKHAAKILEIDERTVRKHIHKIKERAAEAGLSPTFDATRFVDQGQQIVGKSTLTKDDEGNVVWVKTTKKKIAEDMISAIADQVALIKPWPLIKKPVKLNSRKATCYVLTDYHIGAYSWAAETGEDWDIGIAKKVLNNAMSDLIQDSPDSEQAIFCQLGDLLHWDGLLAVTPTAKNILDSDGRFALLTEVALECMLSCVNALLANHAKVHVIMAEGNHDLASSVWLRLIFKKLFGKNKRVTIEDSPFPYYKFSWGNTFLGFHHGHLSRIKQMPGKFYSEFAKEMGESEYRYLHTGHLHTKEVLEDAGVTVERHPTLNARDAHGARGFSKTIRAAQAITYDKEVGEVARTVVYPRI